MFLSTSLTIIKSDRANALCSHVIKRVVITLYVLIRRERNHYSFEFKEALEDDP
jgi:hypothetical protein